MDRATATDLAHRHGITLGADFHMLRSAEVEKITAAADEHKYRAPKNANGSRARSFYAALNRATGN